jgi:hypothetical protein
MPRAKVHFTQIFQFAQETGVPEELALARIFFDLEIGSQKYPDLSADIKQTVGARYEAGPLEVSSVKGYSGPFNHEEFRKEAERYYREAFGTQGSAISFGPGSSLKMGANTVILRKTVYFDIPD